MPKSTAVPPSVRACEPLVPQTGSWGVRLAVDNDRDPYFPLRCEVAVHAHECTAAHEAIVALLEVSPAAMLARKPEFAELACGLAEAFESLTAAVDDCLQANVPWRDLVTCEQILAALDLGIAEEQRLIQSRAYSRFLREHQPL
jgi:hypothetical protein